MQESTLMHIQSTLSCFCSSNTILMCFGKHVCCLAYHQEITPHPLQMQVS